MMLLDSPAVQSPGGAGMHRPPSSEGPHELASYFGFVIEDKYATRTVLSALFTCAPLPIIRVIVWFQSSAVLPAVCPRLGL
jgi:hypothetical protein